MTTAEALVAPRRVGARFAPCWFRPISPTIPIWSRPPFRF